MTEKMKKAIKKIDEAMEKDNTLKVFAQYIIDNAILFSITQGYITLQKAS